MSSVTLNFYAQKMCNVPSLYKMCTISWWHILSWLIDNNLIMEQMCVSLGTGAWPLIHGFSLVNARLLMAFGTAFYAITLVNVSLKCQMLIPEYCQNFC